LDQDDFSRYPSKHRDAQAQLHTGHQDLQHSPSSSFHYLPTTLACRKPVHYDSNWHLPLLSRVQQCQRSLSAFTHYAHIHSRTRRRSGSVIYFRRKKKRGRTPSFLSSDGRRLHVADLVFRWTSCGLLRISSGELFRGANGTRAVARSMLST
jgi:hypothetical protein